MSSFFLKIKSCSYFAHEFFQSLQYFELKEHIEQIIYIMYHTRTHKYINGTRTHIMWEEFLVKKLLTLFFLRNLLKLLKKTSFLRLLINCSFLLFFPFKRGITHNR